MLHPPPPYRLRRMELPDAPAVLEIDKASFPTPMPPQMLERELSNPDLASYQVLTQQTNGNEEILGYAGFWLMAGEVHIVTIAVKPARRREGLGEMLLLNLLLLACQLAPELITLEVRQSNIAAQALYDKFRFAVVGERRRYYPDTGEDAVLMTVYLTDQAGYYDWLLIQAERLGAVWVSAI
jgi:ribosomal-protein-alanine N-acetyltransferase